MATLGRREFLGRAFVAGGAVLLALRGRALAAPGGPGPGESTCLRKFGLARAQALSARPIGEVVAALGMSFVGAPYVAHALERPGPEQLVVNLRSFDCVSFVESSLALAVCVRSGEPTYEAFRRALQRIRYRSGRIEGYASRLHYFTDWIADNGKKGIVRDVTRDLGGAPFVKEINFMSAHRSLYPQLADDACVKEIEIAERRISGGQRWYIPAAGVAGAEAGLQNGDIIAITSGAEGLDVIHTGIVVKKRGIARFLHAPLSRGAVSLTKGPLAAYLADHPSHTGIIVARPLEPERGT